MVKNLVNAKTALLEQQKLTTSDKQSGTDKEQVITHFSPDLVKKLSQSDDTVQKVIKALKGTEDRVAMGSYWRSLWRDLHVTADGCLFLDKKIVSPTMLQPAFLKFLHSSHGGARAMWGRTEYVWFPHIYKSI